MPYMNKCEICKCNKICDHNNFGFEICNNFIPEDVVEVVRCKDCRHCEIIIDQFDNDWYFCKKTTNNAEVKADDFCSYGERKEK